MTEVHHFSVYITMILSYKRSVVYIVSLVIITVAFKQPRCSSADELIMIMWFFVKIYFIHNENFNYVFCR